MFNTVGKVTLVDLFKLIPSGIGLDIAKNHTGVVIWDNGILSEYGFSLEEYDNTDPLAEAKMRRSLRQKLEPVVQGKVFEYGVVEDVFGGENFNTVRKLISLNTVFDEMQLDGVVRVSNYYKMLETEWASYARKIYKQPGKLKSKIETQGLLEYLEYDFYLRNKDKTEAEKKAIYFEDICDACGMLLGVVVKSKLETLESKPVDKLRMSDIKMYYLYDTLEAYSIRDPKILSSDIIEVSLNYRALEKSILGCVAANPNKVLLAKLPSDKLGLFGIKYKFEFYDSEDSCLLFYKKK